MGPDEKTYQDGIDVRRLGSIFYHHSHLYPRSLQPRADGQHLWLPFSIIPAEVSGLWTAVCSIQHPGNAHLVESHFDPVGMDLHFRDQDDEKRTQVLSMEILPVRGKPHSLVQKLLLGTGVGPARRPDRQAMRVHGR